MATGRKFYWIKIKDSFMTSDKVDFLMSQKNGANYVVLYQMLCLKTINTGGEMARELGEVIMPFDEAKIQRDCKYFEIDTIRIALELYKKLGMIYTNENGILQITDFKNMVGSETDYASQKRNQKYLPKIKDSKCKRLNAETLLLPNGKKQFVDEKRYGGNGMKAFDLANGVCEVCGKDNDLLIHHANGYSNEQNDLYVLCKSCHGIAHSVDIKEDWLKHNWVESGVEIFHTEIRDKILDIRDKKIDKDKEKNTLTSFTSLINSFTENLSLREALKDYKDMRLKMSKGFSTNAMKLILNKLSKLSSDDDTKIAIVNQSIENTWKGIFELKTDLPKKNFNNYSRKEIETESDQLAKQRELVERLTNGSY